MTTTLTIRTDEDVKKEASRVFESLGINLSTAINMFLKQTVIQQKFPCSIEAEIAENYKSTYPDGYFELCGIDKDSDVEVPFDYLALEEDIDV